MSSEFGETGERIAATSSDEHGQDRGLAWRRTDQTSISSAPNSSNAPRIPDKEWEEHKYRIYEMYVLKNMPLSQVKEGLKREREFIATTRQYVHQLQRWGIQKYNTKGKGQKRIRHHSEDQNSLQDSSKSIKEPSLPTEDPSPIPSHGSLAFSPATMHQPPARLSTPPRLPVTSEAERYPNPVAIQRMPIEKLPDGSFAPSAGEKRPRHLDFSTEDQNFSCPFRKRNPLRFNIRDHQNCAVQSFPDISQLKRHIKIFHKRKVPAKFECPRCGASFTTALELRTHLAVPNDQICQLKIWMPLDVAHPNPEDGIDTKIEDILNGRRANTKVDTWEVLWRTVFPDDDPYEIPDPRFCPAAEHLELRAHIEENVTAAVAELASQFGDFITIDELGNVLPNLLENIMDRFDPKISNPPNQRRRRTLIGRSQAEPSDILRDPAMESC